MSQDILRTAIDTAAAFFAEGIRLSFVGGEPLLEWPSIRQAVAHACSNLPWDRHPSFEISTNGLLITEEIAEFLDRHEFEIQLSFDGVAEAQDYRQPGTFESLDRLLDRLRQNTPNLFLKRLRVSTIQTPATISRFADSIDYLIRKDVRDISVYPALGSSVHWEAEGIKALEAQFERIYDRSKRHLDATGEVPLALFRKPRRGSNQPGSDAMCSAARGKRLVVDVDGQVYGCVLFAESYQHIPSGFLKSQLMPLKLGDLRASDFQERSAAYRAAVARTEIFGDRRQRYSSYGNCGDCPYLESCRICPVSIGHDPSNTDPRRVPDVFCAFNRTAARYRALFPCLPDPLEKLNMFFRR